MAAAGLGDDLLLANETVDPERLRAMADAGARVTVAVDSDETVDAAAANGIREVLVDVDVGLPRCGCAPDDAGRIADLARARGMTVRGVMGYEGHVVGNAGPGVARRADRAVHGVAARRARATSAVTSCRVAGPAPSTSTRGAPRSRPAPTR